MLARGVKILNIKQQEYFVEKIISSMKENPNFDPQLKYIGYLYPEVVEKIKMLGADVIVDNTNHGVIVNAIVLVDRQREFIKRMLLSTPELDGDPCYSYDGYIPEKTIKYFESEGFEVVVCYKENAIPKVHFTPVDVELTEAEYLRANEYVREFRKVKNPIGRILEEADDD